MAPVSGTAWYLAPFTVSAYQIPHAASWDNYSIDYTLVPGVPAYSYLVSVIRNHLIHTQVFNYDSNTFTGRVGVAITRSRRRNRLDRRCGLLKVLEIIIEAVRTAHSAVCVGEFIAFTFETEFTNNARIQRVLRSYSAPTKVSYTCSRYLTGT